MDSQDTHENDERRSDDTQDLNSDASVVMDLPEIERDAAGIPTFVFRDQLPEGDKPTTEKKTLEVVLLWREAVMTVGHYNEPRDITVGDALKNDFRVSSDSIPVERFPLLSEADGQFSINWTGDMALEVKDEDGEILGLDELAAKGNITKDQNDSYANSSYKLGLHERAAVQVGEVTFVLQFVSPARLITSSLLKTIDYYFTKVLSLSFVGHLFLLLALLLTPLEPNGLDEDLFKNPNRFAQLILKEPEKAPENKPKFELSGSKGGAKHKDKEGKFGKPDKEKKDALASKKGAPKVDPNKREKDRKIAQESGIFAALKGSKDSTASNVFGPGGLGTGINNALGGLRGSAMGDAGGAGGLGTRGTGAGGGGSSLGIGGFGSGTGRGTGGLGDVDLGGRGKGKYKVSVGRTITKGCLTGAVVRRVLGRVQSQAKYCYEKELPRNPNLSGKITTAWVIGPTGGVLSTRIAETTMANANVEQCLLRVIKRLKFPPCAGGGTADVTYPWIFKSGGG
jgi:hypothetical protein